MYLIAESGSTKTHWCLVDKHSVTNLLSTSGINPLILTNAEIESVILPVLALCDQYIIQKIYFFGAGCSTPNAIEKVYNSIRSFFKHSQVFVDSDLIAACLSLAGNQPGIIGLLGTGSNSCLWNGHGVEVQIPSLGYVLGDEGGGVSFGKQLLVDYLKKQMPQDMSQRFAQKYKLTIKQVIERVYQTAMPNRFLASFAPFIEENIDNEYCYNIVDEQFNDFLKKNILLYPNALTSDLYFCGSIAFSYTNILSKICAEQQLNIKKIVKEPIAELAIYFQKNMN